MWKNYILHYLGLLLSVDQGHISYNGEDVTNYNPTDQRHFWRDHAAVVLQDYGIMENESVAFNVIMKKSVFGRSVTGNQERLAQALEQTGLQEREDEPACHLSGGEKQRLLSVKMLEYYLLMSLPLLSTPIIEERLLICLQTLQRVALRLVYRPMISR